MSWLLLRTISGRLEVELDAFASPTDRKLGSYPSRQRAVEAKEAQERADEREALLAAGQKELW